MTLLAGELLRSRGWLADRVQDAGKVWRTSDPGLAATLWWYSASLVLLGPAVHQLARAGRALSVVPDDLRFTITPFGYLERVVTTPGAPDVAAGPAAFGAHLDVALEPILAGLAAAGAVPSQRLWALASDSLGNRLLAEQRTDLAAEIARASAHLRPVPRYVALDAGVVFLRRASCCMVFRLPGQALCVSCPRQEPATRQARLERYAAGG